MSSPEDAPQELWGYLGDECFYRIQVTREQWYRVVSFCKSGLSGIPNWIDLGPASVSNSGDGEWSRREIATDDPRWFTTTYEKMIGPNAEY